MSFLTLYCNFKIIKKIFYFDLSPLPLKIYFFSFFFSLPPLSLLAFSILFFFLLFFSAASPILSLSLSHFFFLFTFSDSLPFFYPFSLSPFLQIWLGFKFVYYSTLVVSFVDFGYGFHGFGYGSGLWLRWWVVVGGGNVMGCGFLFYFIFLP